MRLLFSLCLIAPLWARADVDPPTYATTVYRDVATSSPNTLTTGTPAASGSINPAAQQGQKSQSSGSGANMAAGAAMLAACMMTMPPNIALCAMGAMAMAQGGADKDAAKQSAQTAAASSNSGAMGTNAANTTPTYTDPGKGSGAYSDQVKAGLQALDDAGVKVSPAGVTTADGSKVSAANMGNASAMTSAGFDANAVRDAKKVTDALNAEMAKGVSVSSMATAGGGGGFSAPAAEAPKEEADSKLPPGFDPFGLAGGGQGEAARARALAGKTVNFDGEPIGVRGNNIFEMVHNCYQRKREGNHFIENEAAAVRAPASSASVTTPRPIKK